MFIAIISIWDAIQKTAELGPVHSGFTILSQSTPFPHHPPHPPQTLFKILFLIWRAFFCAEIIIPFCVKTSLVKKE